MNSRENERNQSAGGGAEGRAVTAEECRQLIERVAQHESFRRAARLRELLVYLTERALDGRALELNEHEIAIAVFRRPETFHSADDSIVRSSVRQLRAKLHEYFEGPGRDEAVVVEIPKGSYVPEFRGRQEEIAKTEGPGRWRLVAGVALAGCVVLAGLLAWSVMGGRREAAAPAASNLVTLLFGGSTKDIDIVVCDSALVVVNAYREHLLGLDDYIAQKDQRPLPITGGNPSGATPAEFPGKRLITSFRDMVVLERLSRQAPAAGFGIQLRHSRLMQVRDFKSGSHILLGSPWSNPWVTLFEDQLNFRFSGGEAGGSYGLVNTKPEAGEQGFYGCTPAEARNGVSYARIAVVRNLSGQGAVLLVSGLQTESSEGALDAVQSAEFLEQVKRIAKAQSAEALMGLELLVEVRAVDGVVRGSRLLASRQHGGK